MATHGIAKRTLSHDAGNRPSAIGGATQAWFYMQLPKMNAIECRWSQYWCEICGWKVGFSKFYLWDGASAASRDSGVRCAIETFWTSFGDFANAASHYILARDMRSIYFLTNIGEMVRVQQHNMACCHDIGFIYGKKIWSHVSRQYRDLRHSHHLQRLLRSQVSCQYRMWLAALSTSPRLSQLSFNRISQANIVNSGTRTISCRIVEKKTQSHISHQYRDWRHS